MAFVSRVCSLARRAPKAGAAMVSRPLSTVVSSDDHPEAAWPVRQVFISQSNDIFSNLALEDWLYKNHDFKHKVWTFRSS